MRWLTILLSCFLLGLQVRLWLGAGSWEQIVALERDLEQQRTHNERLAERNNLLALEIHSLKFGLEAVEERARSELGLIKQGETFYLIVDE
jgi:cell division protein FtsB